MNTVSELNEKTNQELREMCVRYGIAGMSKARKEVIVDAIVKYEASKRKPASKQPASSCGCSSTVSLNKPTSNPTVPGEISSIVAGVSSFKNTTGEGGEKYKTYVTVSCGAASGNFHVVGKSVGAVSEFLREVLNIDKLSIGVVNGEKVEDTYILKSSDSLEFLKTGGRKGC